MVSDTAHPLSITSVADDTQSVVALAGELDAGACDDVERALTRAEDERRRRLVIDLRGLTFMDSTGIACVLRARERASTAERELRVLSRPDRQPTEVFELCGLGSLLEMAGPAERPGGAQA